MTNSEKYTSLQKQVTKLLELLWQRRENVIILHITLLKNSHRAQDGETEGTFCRSLN